MSVTLSPPSKRTQKSTCNKCQRTVVIATIDGVKTPLEAELIAVVEYDVTPSARIVARQLHVEKCLNYRLENERRAERVKRRRIMGR